MRRQGLKIGILILLFCCLVAPAQAQDSTSAPWELAVVIGNNAFPEQDDIYILDTLKGTLKNITRNSTPIMYNQMAWLPDKKTLVVDAWVDQTKRVGNYGAFTVLSLNTETGVQNQLTPDKVSLYPSYASQKIAYMAFKGNDYTINVMDSDGKNQQQVAELPASGVIIAMALSPDGESLAYIFDDDVSCARLFLLNLDNKRRDQLTSDENCVEFALAWSPDSKQIAFPSVADGQIYALDVAKRTARQVTQKMDFGCTSPAWSPDGKSLAFVGAPYDTRQPTNIYIVDVATSRDWPVLKDPSPDVRYGWLASKP